MKSTRLSSGEGSCEDGLGPDAGAPVVTSEPQSQGTIELAMSDKQHALNETPAAVILPPSNPSTSEKKAVRFGPSLDILNDNEAPIPVGQSTNEDKEVKKNKGPEVLTNESQPLNPSIYDDSLLKEKEKINKQTGSTPMKIQQTDQDTTSSRTTPQPNLEESISTPCIDEEMLPARSTMRQTETTAATTLSDETIFDAFSQRASTVKLSQDDEIFIPEATLVEEPTKEDIPSAEIVVPEKYSVTIAGKKFHAGALILAAVVILVLVVGLSVSLTRSGAGGVTVAPTVSSVPSASPSIKPSSSPTSELYSSLVGIVYGDGVDQIDYNQERRAAMEWLAQDQADASSALSDEQMRERYALALLYFITNAENSWYDDINFLSEGHICTWRMKRSGEKKGVLLCSEDERALQLDLYANSLQGTLPMELSFLTELQVLRLDANRIKSTMPDEIGSLSQLSELILNSNLLTGSIPDTFANLGNLTTLYLSDNIISGPLLEVNNIPNLNILRVDGNNLSGGIPDSFSSLYLGTFHINRNRIAATMDFMCNKLPQDYKMDCDGDSPEVICTCCVGCTIVGDDECEENQDMASITISAGKFDDTFSWWLYEETIDEYDWPFDSLIAAGGEYEANEEIYFQMCLDIPGTYSFSTSSTRWNGTDDSGASISLSMDAGEVLVGPQDYVTFLLVDGSLVTTTPSPSPKYDSYDTGSYESGYECANCGFAFDDDAMSEISSISFGMNCFGFELQLRTDSFGEETSWDVVNTLDGEVFASRNGGYYDSNATHYEYQCLDSNGCYNFTIYDQWNDGICCESGNGWFSVSVNNRFIYKGGDYQASDTVAIGGSCSSDVPSSGSCQDGESPINVTILTDANSWEMSWEVYDNSTGQIYCLSSDVMEENSLQTTYKCIPEKECMAFAISDTAGNGFNETSDGFVEVTYRGEVVASSSGDFGHHYVAYFGTECN